jgi:outer membrane protein assembly factor BamB
LIRCSRILGVALGLLLLVVVLSACGAAPVAQNWPGLTAANDALYVISGSPQQVYILDATTGVQKGIFMPQGQHRGILYWSPVTVANDNLAVSTLQGPLAFVGFADPTAKVYGLYAFDAKTGQEQWNVSTQSASLILAAPVYSNGVVYFGSDDGKVYGVDVKTHAVKPGWPFQAKNSIWASPLVAGGRLYVASMGHHLYCLDAESGQLLWDFEAKGAMAAQPQLEANRTTVYIGDFNAHVYAVDANSGKPVSGFDFRAGNWIWSEVLPAGDRLYVASLDGKLHALDPATGKELAPFPFVAKDATGTSTPTPARLRAAPVQAGDATIIASEKGTVTAVNNTSALEKWHWPSSGAPTVGILTTPVVAGDTVYVILVTGQVYALQLDSGVQVWAFTPPAG